MKKARILAGLLAVAMLAMAWPAFGEELTIHQADEIPEEGQIVEPASDDAAGLLIDLEQAPGADELLVDLAGPGSDAALPDAKSDATDVVPNGDADAQRVLRVSAADAMDSDALLYGYLDELFGKAKKRNGYVGDRLTGTAKQLYDCLAPEIRKVAAGERGDTVFRIPAEVTPNFSWDLYYGDMVAVMNALLSDYPYQLYWFNKVKGIPPSYDGQLILPFTVEDEYAKDIDKDPFMVDTKKTRSVQTSVNNAKRVVLQNAGRSDYEKLCAYRDYICEHVNYNYPAVEDPTTPYGNPWQLIWAFDEDPSTDIVCEGYSKAFQYLCDLTDFKSSIRCLSTTGDGGSSPDDWGAHMFNIVRMEDGKNYLVDITFCDGGLPEDFLVGTPDVSEGGEAFYAVNGKACYHFDQETLDTFPPRMLKLSHEDYVPKADSVSIVQGKSATLYMGNTLTLEAQVKPAAAKGALTWKSSNPKVASVDGETGVVTPKRAGKTTVTVKTANGKSAKITVRVVDAKSVRLKKGQVTLKDGVTIGLKRGRSLTLKAVVSPAKVKTGLTWKGGGKGVSVKEGTVTAAADAKVGAKVKITVKTANGKRSCVYIKVK